MNPQQLPTPPHSRPSRPPYSRERGSTPGRRAALRTSPGKGHQPMPEQPTYDDLVTIVNRDRAVKEILANRVATLSLEVAELHALVIELRQAQRVPSVNPQEVDGADPATRPLGRAEAG
jgi:hypothetical protein